MFLCVVCVLPEFMSVCHVPAWYLWRTKDPEVRKDMGSSETGVTEDPETRYGCWESNPCPQKEQQVLLTAEQSLQLQNDLFLNSYLFDR